MEKSFDDIFNKDVDDNERGYNPMETITVRRYHTWNWDMFMEEAITYAFIKYWDSYGVQQLQMHRSDEIGSSRASRMLKGLEICYARIVNNNDVFFGDGVYHAGKLRRHTLDFIWKHRGYLWD